MTLFAGTNIDLKARGTDGFTRDVIIDASCTINLFAPPKNPKLNPGDRTSPDASVPAVFDPVSRYYLATMDKSVSAGKPGIWWMQAVLSGGAANYYAFDFFSFTLSP